MRPASFPEPPRGKLRAGIFAADLRQRCEAVFEVFAGDRTQRVTEVIDVTRSTSSAVAWEVVALPVTIPIDEEGFVLIGPATLDCAKRPATMEVVRPGPKRPGGAGHTAKRFPYRFGIALLPLDALPLVIPGVVAAESAGEQPAASCELTFAIADAGFAAVGYEQDGTAVALTMTEHTAGELATALLIALGVKLMKAERGDY